MLPFISKCLQEADSGKGTLPAMGFSHQNQKNAVALEESVLNPDFEGWVNSQEVSLTNANILKPRFEGKRPLGTDPQNMKRIFR